MGFHLRLRHSSKQEDLREARTLARQNAGVRTGKGGLNQRSGGGGVDYMVYYT